MWKIVVICFTALLSSCTGEDYEEEGRIINLLFSDDGRKTLGCWFSYTFAYLPTADVAAKMDAQKKLCECMQKALAGAR
uniref:Venom protein n=1 Tax=Hadrurus spadix TaxID=141984 RepID=A0A1W7R936_9SCOR